MGFAIEGVEIEIAKAKCEGGEGYVRLLYASTKQIFLLFELELKVTAGIARC